MADPLIDEHIIIDLIETEISLDGAERLMAGASLLLIDALGKLDAAMIQDAVNRAAKLVEQYAAVAARQAHMLKECPLSTDKVH